MFNFFNPQLETVENFFLQSAENFLKTFAPNRLRILRNALQKINFKNPKGFYVDLTMPMNVGGYFSPDNGMIAINPMVLLYGTEQEIAHILFHEGLHAGIYTQSSIMDEALVESMTKKKIHELYGGQAFKSGYDDIVEEINEFFGDMSFESMSNLIEDGDQSTFDNLLKVIVVDKSINDGLDALSWQSIEYRLGKNWKTLQTLFPRMMNKLAGKNVGLHAPANVSLHQFELEGVLAKAAMQIVSEHPELLDELMEKILEKRKISEISNDELVEQIFNSGFGYIYDFDPSFIEKKIKEFRTKRTIWEMAEAVKNLKITFPQTAIKF